MMKRLGKKDMWFKMKETKIIQPGEEKTEGQTIAGFPVHGGLVQRGWRPAVLRVR